MVRMGLFTRRAKPAPASLGFSLDHASHTYVDGTVGLTPTTLMISEKRVAVVGLNGSGKSTLLGLLDGTLLASGGMVTLFGGGETIDPAAKRDKRRLEQVVGRVRREEIPNSFMQAKDIGQAVEEKLKRAGFPESERHAIVGDLFAHFSLSDMARRGAGELNAEQRHLLAIVAALAHSPAAIVADEPTKGLDERGAAHVAKALFSYDRQVVFATHDMGLATRPEYAVERVLVLDDKHVVFDGAPDEAVAFYDDLVRRRFEEMKAGSQR